MMLRLKVSTCSRDDSLFESLFYIRNPSQIWRSDDRSNKIQIGHFDGKDNQGIAMLLIVLLVWVTVMVLGLVAVVHEMK